MKTTSLWAAMAAATFLGLADVKAQWTNANPTVTTDNVQIGSSGSPTNLSVSGTSTLTGVTNVGTNTATSATALTVTTGAINLGIPGTVGYSSKSIVYDYGSTSNYTYTYLANWNGGTRNNLIMGGRSSSGNESNTFWVDENGNGTFYGAVTVATSTLPTVPSSGGHVNSLQFAVAGSANISNALIVGATSGFTATTPFPTGYSVYAASGILTEKVKVASKTDNTNWSDFVFDKSYKLRSLNEVEKFISKNHHLPEIPSQEEVNKNGVDLLEMDAKLLQKIEELTLYMIEMKKENETMKKELELLKKENN